MGWSKWETCWKGDEKNPTGVIPKELLPCDYYQYRYAIRTEIDLSSLEGNVYKEFTGILTNHIGKSYKETIYPTFLFVYVPYPLIPFPYSTLFYFTLQYLDYKEKRIFYKWLELNNLEEALKDKVQKEQTLLFNFKKSEVKIDKTPSNLFVESQNNKFYIESDLFSATAGNQNVAKDLLEGEEIEILNGDYVGKKFEIRSNDGKGKVYFDPKDIDTGAEIDFQKLPDDTQFKIKPKYAWVAIGETIGGKFSWYGNERYSFEGEAGFVFETPIMGLFSSLTVPFVGFWYSNIINTMLAPGDQVWIDQHNLGIPGLGPKYAYYEIRTTEADRQRVCGIRKRDCYVYLLSYIDNKGYLKVLEKSIDVNTHSSKTRIINLGGKEGKYRFPNVSQFPWLDLFFAVQNEFNTFLYLDFSRLNLEKTPDSAGLEPLILKDFIEPFFVDMGDELVMLCRKKDEYIYAYKVSFTTTEAKSVIPEGYWQSTENLTLYELSNVSKILEEQYFEGTQRFSHDYNMWGATYSNNSNEVRLWFKYGNRIQEYKANKSFSIISYIRTIKGILSFFWEKQVPKGIVMVYSFPENKNQLYYAFLPYDLSIYETIIDVNKKDKIVVKKSENEKVEYDVETLPKDIKPPIDIISIEARNVRELIIANKDGFWKREAEWVWKEL